MAAKNTTSTVLKKARRVFSASTFIQRSRRESSEQKAIWHQVTGAGRRGVLRQFFGLTSEEQATVKQVLEGQIAARLRKAGA
jgi:hypothetical protein